MSRNHLSLATIARFEPLMGKERVSEVARSPRGFLTAYKRAGSWSALPDVWKDRREAFIARHMAQVRQNREPLWEDGEPTRRHLALIAWAYSPDASRLGGFKPNPPPAEGGRFVGQDELFEEVEEAHPSYDYVVPAEEDEFTYVFPADEWDGPVTWGADGEYVVMVPVSNIQFAMENLWYPEHAAALLEGIEEGDITVLRAPAARVHPVRPYDIEETQEEARRGTLEEDSLMVRPWTEDDSGTYRAVLLDGNHRVLAAMLAGATEIPVYVGENYRDNIDPNDWAI